jgi:hypothetical protein
MVLRILAWQDHRSGRDIYHGVYGISAQWDPEAAVWVAESQGLVPHPRAEVENPRPRILGVEWRSNADLKQAGIAKLF